MQTSTVLLTNEYSAFTVNMPSMATIKIEPSDDDFLVLLDSNEDVCHVVDHSDTSHFPYKTKGPSTPAVVGHVIMPKFIINLFCIHITSGMKQCVDVESELDKRWLESKMCNSAVNTISEIFL